MPYYNNMQSYNNANPRDSTGSSKSLSFLNFGNNNVQQPPPPPSNLTNFQRSSSREKLNQFTLMQQQHHMQFTQMPPPPPPPQQQLQGGNSTTNAGIYGHRHSLNALLPFPQQQQQQFMNRRNSSCGTDRMHSEKNVSDTASSDINSRLESLCRQMTEQF